MIVAIGLGSFTIRGSAIKKPDTSVQFSYKSAQAHFATIEPVISLPPLEKALIRPDSSFNCP